MTLKIAFLGLGGMGTPMATRLLAAGHPLTVWNRTPAKAEALAARGAAVAATPADAVREADVVISMLADPAAVTAVVDSAAPQLRPGAHWLEMSTIGPDAVRDLADRLPDGVTLLDAPVMGSVDKAAAGELGILVGGDADGVEALRGVRGAARVLTAPTLLRGAGNCASAPHAGRKGRRAGPSPPDRHPRSPRPRAQMA